MSISYSETGLPCILERAATSGLFLFCFVFVDFASILGGRLFVRFVGVFLKLHTGGPTH